MNWRAYALMTGALVCCLASLGGTALVSQSVRDDYATPSAIPYPDDNPYSLAKEKLGEQLFFDPLLSGSKMVSCATCHRPELGWGDGRPRAIGVAGEPLAVRTPATIDLAWVTRFGWDGKFRDLESVAFTPITAAGNMNLPENELVARVAAVPDYRRLFTEAFGAPDVSRRHVEMALATYERTIVYTDSPFDAWIAGDETAISVSAKRGFEIFNGKGGCSGCHSGWAFTDGSFHDIGTATGDDIGRGRFFPTSLKLKYAFKTPTLRDVALRAPYMHDGSVPTLEAVIALYDKGGIDRPSRSESIRPLHLRDDEKADLIAFLNALTSPPKPVPSVSLSH